MAGAKPVSSASRRPHTVREDLGQAPVPFSSRSPAWRGRSVLGLAALGPRPQASDPTPKPRRRPASLRKTSLTTKFETKRAADSSRAKGQRLQRNVGWRFVTDFSQCYTMAEYTEIGVLGQV
jgi:hypothetical protein